MTPDQVELVQQSFAKVAPISETAAVLFYDRLFEIAPVVKPLFHGDMAEQRRKLMATLAVVVGGLSDLPSVLPAAERARRISIRAMSAISHVPWVIISRTQVRRRCNSWRSSAATTT